MLKYSTILASDETRVAREFFALFARSEFALKKGGFGKLGPMGEAKADWDGFADSTDALLASVSAKDLAEARRFLLSAPPKRQVLDHGALTWVDNPRRPKETDARYLLRIVRDVRNNLFHGGKWPVGPETDTARDKQLLASATTVLHLCIMGHPVVREAFEDGA